MGKKGFRFLARTDERAKVWAIEMGAAALAGRIKKLEFFFKTLLKLFWCFSGTFKKPPFFRGELKFQMFATRRGEQP